MLNSMTGFAREAAETAYRDADLRVAGCKPPFP